MTANGNGASANSAEVAATPQAIVSGLTATPGSGQIVLNWNGSPGANYNVKRSIVSGSSYSTIASSITGTNYTDSNVVTCQTYYYVVTVTNAGNESLPSGEANATLPGGAPPSPWLHGDVGSVGFPGNVTYCNGQFTITGSGADIWGTADAFQFVYVNVPVSTNCDIRARVVSVQNTSGNAKAGVMIREALAAGARQATADVEPTAGLEFLYRTSTNGATSSATASGGAPNWVRMTRTNNTFRAYWSPDGSSWTQIGSPTNINMGVSAYVGLVVCAHDNTKINTSVFDNVSASFLTANTVPTLAPIANQTVNVGQTVALTAAATDNDTPQPTLNFSLLNGPASATLVQINNSNANFNWRPAVTSANTTNPVSLKVAVSGSPSLSATQNFSVTVNPLTLPTVPTVGWNNGQFTMLVTNSIVGPDYAVLGSSNLINWSTLFITNSPPTGSFQWTDTNATPAPEQFYRIKIGPPLP